MLNFGGVPLWSYLENEMPDLLTCWKRGIQRAILRPCAVYGAERLGRVGKLFVPTQSCSQGAFPLKKEIVEDAA